MAVIIALERQENHECEASLGYTTSSTLGFIRHCLKKNEKLNVKSVYLWGTQSVYLYGHKCMGFCKPVHAQRPAKDATHPAL